MTPAILNLAELAVGPLPAGLAPPGHLAERYAPRIAMIGALTGMRQLGCNLIALAPGKRAFPFHNHRVNEEMFLVLAGQGEIRLGDARHPIRAGDVISCPAGGPETAHQIANTGGEELRYLAISTKASPDIIEFPDSGKYRVRHEPSADGTAGFEVMGRHEDDVPYWQGE